MHIYIVFWLERIVHSGEWKLIENAFSSRVVEDLPLSPKLLKKRRVRESMCGL